MLSLLLYTLGCKLNQLESEALADAFAKNGFSLFPWNSTQRPSVIIINTCTVTSRSDQKARRVIRKSLAENPHSAVIVTGCYAKLDREKILALDNTPPQTVSGEGRLFVTGEKSSLLDLPAYLRENVKDDHAGALSPLIAAWFEKSGGGAAAEVPPEHPPEAQPCRDAFCFKPERFSFHTRGFLKIQDGCDNHCTYCRVRLARGPSVSMPADKVLDELQALENRGLWEAVLTGVNIRHYRDDGLPGAPGLGGLLQYLLAGTSAIGIRLSSIEPDVTEEFAAVLAHPRIRPHFHLALQSGSDSVLRKMGRSYTASAAEHSVSLLRSIKNNPFLACDIITGFPGETAADFEQTCALCQKIGFTWIHAFPYSKRPGTAAFSVPQTITEQEAARRVERLNKMAEQGRRNYTESWLGHRVEAMVEQSHLNKPGSYRGISENYLKLLIRCPETVVLKPGTAVMCTISELAGRMIGELSDEVDAHARLAEFQ